MKDKEQQILEMADLLFDYAEDYCDADGHIITNKLAETLYESGYHKADEVRRETAKEILQEIYDEIDYYSCQPAIEQLAKEYGVEVEK